MAGQHSVSGARSKRRRGAGLPRSLRSLGPGAAARKARSQRAPPRTSRRACALQERCPIRQALSDLALAQTPPWTSLR